MKRLKMIEQGSEGCECRWDQGQHRSKPWQRRQRSSCSEAAVSEEKVGENTEQFLVERKETKGTRLLKEKWERGLLKVKFGSSNQHCDQMWRREFSRVSRALGGGSINCLYSFCCSKEYVSQKQQTFFRCIKPHEVQRSRCANFHLLKSDDYLRVYT